MNLQNRKHRAILAIDFDNTIAKTYWPTICKARRNSVKYINRLYDKGYYIIIWTCRAEQDLLPCQRFLKLEGIKYHSINEQHPQLIAAFQNDSRKISADIYIDDKGIWLFGLPPWFILYRLIRIKTLFLTSILNQFK